MFSYYFINKIQARNLFLITYSETYYHIKCGCIFHEIRLDISKPCAETAYAGNMCVIGRQNMQMFSEDIGAREYFWFSLSLSLSVKYPNFQNYICYLKTTGTISSATAPATQVVCEVWLENAVSCKCIPYRTSACLRHFKFESRLLAC